MLHIFIDLTRTKENAFCLTGKRKKKKTNKISGPSALVYRDLVDLHGIRTLNLYSGVDNKPSLMNMLKMLWMMKQRHHFWIYTKHSTEKSPDFVFYLILNQIPSILHERKINKNNATLVWDETREFKISFFPRGRAKTLVEY